LLVLWTGTVNMIYMRKSCLFLKKVGFFSKWHFSQFFFCFFRKNQKYFRENYKTFSTFFPMCCMWHIHIMSSAQLLLFGQFIYKLSLIEWAVRRGPIKGLGQTSESHPSAWALHESVWLLNTEKWNRDCLFVCLFCFYELEK
jgi:hypothetical protein